MIGRLKPHKHIPDVEILNKVKLGTEMYSVILYMPHYGDSLHNIFTQHKNPPFERTVAILKEFLEQTRKSSSIYANAGLCIEILHPVTSYSMEFSSSLTMDRRSITTKNSSMKNPMSTGKR